MAELNIPEILIELHRVEQIVSVCLDGLKNFQRLDFTVDEMKEINKLVTVYTSWKNVVGVLIEQMTALQTLGYPELPRLEVNAAMKASTERERNQNVVADDLFYVVPPAVQANVSFSEPEKQPVSQPVTKK